MAGGMPPFCTVRHEVHRVAVDLGLARDADMGVGHAGEPAGRRSRSREAFSVTLHIDRYAGKMQ
jgi:hypothetical protein